MTNPINSSSTPLPQTTGSSAASAAQQTSSTAAERQAIATGGNNEPSSAAVEARERSAQEISQATQDISDYIQSVSRSLQISVDGDLGTTVIQVLDSETAELVRQIPAEEALAIARFIAEQRSQLDTDSTLRGVLIDQEG